MDGWSGGWRAIWSQVPRFDAPLLLPDHTAHGSNMCCNITILIFIIVFQTISTETMVIKLL